MVQYRISWFAVGDVDWNPDLLRNVLNFYVQTGFNPRNRVYKPHPKFHSSNVRKKFSQKMLTGVIFSSKHSGLQSKCSAH